MNRRTQMVTFLASLVGLSLILAAASADQVQRFFSYGKKPSTGLIEVTLEATMPAVRTVYAVFTDGRVEIKRYMVGGADSTLIETLRGHLDAGEVDEMVKAAVDSGLATYDARAMAAATKSGVVAVPSEGSSVKFKIALDYLAEGTAPAREPFTHTFYLESAPVLGRGEPTQPPLLVFRRITERLREIQRAARKESVQ